MLLKKSKQMDLIGKSNTRALLIMLVSLISIIKKHQIGNLGNRLIVILLWQQVRISLMMMVM